MVVERCPACGARMQPRVMDEESGFTWKDFFNYSWVTIFFILVAIFVPLGPCVVVPAAVFLKSEG